MTIKKIKAGNVEHEIEAASANKLNANAGSATSPVYFADGVPVECTYDLNKTVPSDALFTDTDTKNTAGSTNSSKKLYLIGAESQAASPQTYSHDTAYVGTDGCLYSNSTKVSIEGHTHNDYVNQKAFSNVTVDSTTIAADSTTDTLTMAAGTGISVSADATNDKVTITNSGVHSIATGSANGTISVNTNGSSADVAVKGLGSAAYTASTAYDAAGAADTALTSAKSYTDGKVSGLASTFSVNSAISTHNSSTSAHEDIRTTLAGVKEDVDTFFKDADLTTSAKDTLKEIQDYIISDASAAADMLTAIGSKSAKTHTHTVSHTPAGTVSKPTFSGTEGSTTSISGTDTVYSITSVGTLPSCTYTAPSHSYTAPSLTASCTNKCLTLTFSAGSHSFSAGSHSFSAGTLPTKSSGVSVATGTHTHKYTPAGSVSQPTFSGTVAALTTSGANS